MAVTDIATPSWLKTNYLYGIDLTDDTGTAFPDSLYLHAIDSAISTVEAEFDIDLRGPTKRVERYDTHSQHGISWFLLHLQHKPLVSVDSLNIQFANFPQADLPVEWVQVADSITSQVQILPGPEALANTAFSGGVPFVGIQGIMFRDYTPLWWKYSYTTGFEHDLAGTVDIDVSGVVTGTDTTFVTPSLAAAKTPATVRPGDWVRVSGTDSVFRVKSASSDTKITLSSYGDGVVSGKTLTLLKYPSDILDCVGLVASMLPLDTAGDLIIGAGISRLNVGVDGLHQEIQTTSGVENSGYGARALQYRRRLKDIILSIKRKYNPPKVMVM